MVEYTRMHTDRHTIIINFFKTNELLSNNRKSMDYNDHSGLTSKIKLFVIFVYYIKQIYIIYGYIFTYYVLYALTYTMQIGRRE